MNRDTIAKAVAEARRFIEKAEALPEPRKYEVNGRQHTDDHHPREQGAIRRASMDLTRSLADMRRSG